MTYYLLVEIVNIIIITTVLYIILDVWSWVERFKYWLYYKIYNKSIKYRRWTWKPLDCSFCMSYWISLIYMILFQPFSIATFTLPFIGMFINIIIKK